MLKNMKVSLCFVYVSTGNKEAQKALGYIIVKLGFVLSLTVCQGMMMLSFELIATL